MSKHPGVRSIPPGVACFGWHTYTSGGLSALAKLSVGHLVPETQVRDVRGSTEQRAQGPALCGRDKSGRHARMDSLGIVEGELRRGERKACERCFLVALMDTAHVLDISRPRVVGGSPIRGGGNSYAVNAHCACGVTFGGSGYTSREIRTAHRDHVRAVLHEGLFRVEREGYAEPLLCGPASAAHYTGHPPEALTTLVLGESVGGKPVTRHFAGGEEPYATAERIIEAVIADG